MDRKIILSHFWLSRPVWHALRCGMPGYRAVQTVYQRLEKLWQMTLHVPAVHRAPWCRLPPSPSRELMMRSPYPVLMGEERPLPAGLAALPPRLQMKAVGTALLDSLITVSPFFSRSLLSGKLIESRGVTILATMLDDAGDVLAVPWDHGDSWVTVLRRAVDCKQFVNHPLYLILHSQLKRYANKPVLPPPQAVVSIVGQMGIMRPWSSPMGCGGQSPIVVCVGSETITFVLDHRVYDAAPTARLYVEFFGRLEEHVEH